MDDVYLGEDYCRAGQFSSDGVPESITSVFSSLTLTVIGCSCDSDVLLSFTSNDGIDPNNGGLYLEPDTVDCVGVFSIEIPKAFFITNGQGDYKIALMGTTLAGKSVFIGFYWVEALCV